MQNKITTAFAITAALLLALHFSYAQLEDTGCCSNPNAGLNTCNSERFTRQSQCCPSNQTSSQSYYRSQSNPFGPANPAECISSYFFSAKDCEEIQSCSLGCCCEELGGAVTSKAACVGAGTVFHEGNVNCNSICPKPQCADGIDNDNNGCADFENGDTGCSSLADAAESGGVCADNTPQCQSSAYIPKLSNLQILAVKGEKKFRLSWNDECQLTAASYKIYRCTGSCASMQLLNTVTSNNYIDDSAELSFASTYTYKIAALYSQTPVQSYINGTGRLGSDKCLNRKTTEKFCSENSAYYCDSYNNLIAEGTRCSSSQVCIISPAGSPSCSARSSCNYNNANPFGLFYTLEGCENGRYCFYDKSHSTVNSCFSCKEDMSCYDYKSKESCERNNCRAGTCQWKPIDSQLGTGACIDTSLYNCRWCSNPGTPQTENLRSYNQIFDSCTREKSNALSNPQHLCYYKNSVSKNCNEVVCPDYELSECVQQVALGESNRFSTQSNDQCSIKACQIFNGACAKNSDGDNQKDCDSSQCEIDYFAPNTSVQQVLSKGIPKQVLFEISDKVSSNGSYLLRQPAGYKTYLCIEPCEKTSHPFAKFTQSGALLINGLAVRDFFTGEVFGTLSEGQNTLKFYSQDPAKNVEEVKSISITARANSTSPEIRRINVTDGRTFGDVVYSSKSKPTIQILFFDRAIITYARLTSQRTGFGINLATGTDPLIEHLLSVQNDLPDGNYFLDINAKNTANLFMSRQERYIISIDTKAPSIELSPSNNAITNNSQVLFSIRSDEAVTLESATLNSAQMRFNFSTQDNTLFTAQYNTSDGNKQFSATVKDYAGNSQTKQSSFTVDANPTEISMKTPKYGSAPSYDFDIEIETDNTAQCRWSFDESGLEFDFMDIFTSASQTSHRLENFNRIKSPDERKHRMNVKCKDERNRISSRDFEISVDTTPPQIRNIFAYPNPVVESPSRTSLTVETNEPAICRYSPSKETFSEMELRFNGYDSSRFSAANAQNITLQEEKEYSFNAACINRAELASSTEKITVKVNLSFLVSVASRTQAFFNTTSAALIVETNKISQCKYSQNQQEVELGELINPIAGYIHRKDLSVSNGKHVFYVKCRDSYLSQWSETIQVSFTVDTTAPLMEYVDDTSSISQEPEKSCIADRLRVRISAEDQETGIREYYYSLNRKQDDYKILNFTKAEREKEFFWVKNLNLSNQTEYYFTAYSNNFAGHSSNTMSSNGITIDTSACIASELACSQTGSCNQSAACAANSDCDSGFCSPLTKKCTVPTCSDGIKNQQETSADCAGPCAKCQNGKTCSSNSDCSSGSCYYGTCRDPDKCADAELTPGESDIDCGGPCFSKCSEGQHCDGDESCAAGTKCQDSVCKTTEDPEQETPAATDSDGDGLPDDWEIENGMDANDPSDAESDSDGDGLTNYEEYSQQNYYGQSTNPLNQDTDGDGVTDKEEIDAGTNPLDPQDFAKSSLLSTLLIIFVIVSLLGGFGYFGYRIIEKRKEEASFKPSLQQPRFPAHSSQQQRNQNQPASKQIIQVQQLQQKQQGFAPNQRELEKEKERSRLFEAFDEKNIQAGKPYSQVKELAEKQSNSEIKKPVKRQKQALPKIPKKTNEDSFVKLKEVAKELRRKKRK